MACRCAKEIAKEFRAILSAAPTASHIYQTSLMSGLIAGVYDGDVTVADLLKHGDFGLGTFNQVDGELVAFDGQLFQLRDDGSARQASLDQKTPFAVMTFFKPVVEHQFTAPATKAEVHAVIDSLVPSDNLFCAARIDGSFSSMKTRTPPRQEKPYQPLLKVLEKQKTFTFDLCEGVIAGFRSPQYTQGINVAGYHEHFITSERTGGGHILNYTLEKGKLQLGIVSKLVIDMPRTPEFLGANMNHENLSSIIKTAEG